MKRVENLRKRINDTLMLLQKARVENEGSIIELRNCKRKTNVDNIIDFYDIYREVAIKLEQIRQKNEETESWIKFYEDEIKEEKENASTQSNQSTLPKLKNTNKNVNYDQNFPRNIQNRASQVKSPLYKDVRAYIARRNFITQQLSEQSQNTNIPVQQSYLPKIDIRKINTTPPVTLESCVGKEKAEILVSYMNILLKFRTTEPERICELFKEAKKSRSRLLKKLNLIDRDCRKLQNKANALKLAIKPASLRKEYLEFKIHQLAKMVKIDPVPHLADTLHAVKGVCRVLMKAKRQKKLEEQQKIRAQSKVVFANLQMKQVGSGRNKKQVKQIVTLNDIDIPSLSLTGEIVGDFVPGTRITRRMFGIVAADQNEEEVEKTRKNSLASAAENLITFGNILGSAFVERFATMFVKYPEARYEADEYEIDRPTRLFISNAELDNQKIVLAELFRNYKEAEETLHLTLYSVDEIHRIDHTFIDFISIRDQLVDAFVKIYNEKLLLDMLTTLMTENITAACYAIRDLVKTGPLKGATGILLGKLVPYFVQIEDPKDYIPFLAVFSTFLKTGKNDSLHKSIVTLLNERIKNYVEELIVQPQTPISRSSLLIIFKIAQHHPALFLDSILVKNRTESNLECWMTRNRQFKTCMITGIYLFQAARHLLNEESLMWHFHFFYHNLIIEFNQTEMRTNIINALLGAMTNIVANRSPLIVEQLSSNFFLQFIMKQIELESLVGEKPVPKPQPPQPKITFSAINKVLPKLNLDNPKMQLHFPPTREGPFIPLASITTKEYSNDRSKYPIYFNEEIHVRFIQLIFAVLIDHSLHNFDREFVDPFPHVNRRPNVLFTVMRHMESKDNDSIMQSLKKEFSPHFPNLPKLNIIGKVSHELNPLQVQVQAQAQEQILPQGKKPPTLQLHQLSGRLNQSVPDFIAQINEDDLMDTSRSITENLPEGQTQKQPKKTIIDTSEQFKNYYRFLKLLVPSLFDATLYEGGQHIGSGAFGAVMMVTLDGVKYAVKILQKSRNVFDNPKLVDVFSEISILDFCKGDRRVTQLVNYGSTQDNYYVVMEYYPKTLKSWRKSVAENPPYQTILRVYREFLNSATILTDYQINHFDIKCDNVMLDTRGYPALADFGESMCYKNESSSFTLLNKGTEWIKSPEMLSIAINSAKTNPNFDRRKPLGAGPASDIWSIGCLFFELVTGEFLFVDSDWSRFFFRVTDQKQALMTPQATKMLPKDLRYLNFIEFVLQRNVERRPNLAQVINKFDEYFPEALSAPLPVFEQ